MAESKSPVQIKDDYVPDAMKKTRDQLFGDFRYMPTRDERIGVRNFFIFLIPGFL
jgi:hypothetical protein